MQLNIDTFENNNRDKLIENAIKKYSNLIFRIAYNNLGNYYDAQDILQEVGMSLVTHNAPLNDEYYLQNWLCKVTINKCKNFIKLNKYRTYEPLADDIPFEERKSLGILEELNKLSIDYRNVLYLYYYEEFTIEEIAEVTGKNKNTVASQLRRGRKKLEKILIDGGYNDD